MMKVLKYKSFNIINEKYNLDGEIEDEEMDESVSDMFTLADLYDKEEKTLFFKEFIEIFPTKRDFDKELKKYYKFNKEDDEEEFDEKHQAEKYWNPEIEVKMLEKELMSEYPGDEVWINFINDLIETEWNE